MDILHYVGPAALLVSIVALFMRTMPALRLLASIAAVLGIAAGAIAGTAWLWIGAAMALAVNLWRDFEARATVKRLAGEADPSPTALFALVARETLGAGQVLFKRGDPGEEMYLVVEGEIEIVELGKTLGAGQVLGEVALLVPTHKRTATARAKGAVTLARMTRRDMELTALQNPAFGFELLKLVARRLSDDVERLERRAER
ncbi:MAG: cyclic nucleotide-binding domain-containing protein [Alphaproteobacteria bacterium]|nr:cyclic nucleotide-binding domain-containing protein [Alphaproteobacteria bacterium]